MAEEAEWVTVSEAARRLGVSRQAIRGKIVRGTIPYQMDNHGHPLVKAIPPLPGTPRNGMERKAPPSTLPPTTPEPAWAPSLDDVRRLLGEQAGRLERQHNAAITALQAAHREAMSMLVERVDTAECRLESLLEHMTRPWWVRWFGQSKRSDIRE